MNTQAELRDKVEKIIYDLPIVPNSELFPEGSSYVPPSILAVEALLDLIKSSNAEAVREFAEKVKEKIISTSNTCDWDFPIAFVDESPSAMEYRLEKQIDQLISEITEEK